MYIGRDFKRDIELDKLTKIKGNLRPNRSWIDLFSLSLSNYYNNDEFDLTILIDNLSEDEVIIVDSHDDIFKEYQIHFWRKDRISDILPAIKCPSFKSKTKIFKTSEMKEIGKFIKDQDHTKSIVIEKSDKELSINLIYGDTIKNISRKSLNKLQERYKFWEIDDCACKPKKIRAQEWFFGILQYAINMLLRISNITDVKLGIHINKKNYNRSFPNYDTMVFSDSIRWISDKTSKFIFSGDKLTVVSIGKSYNLRLDQRTKESKDSYIEGKIIGNKSKNCFALDVNNFNNLSFIQTDKVNKNSEYKYFIEDLKKISVQEKRCFIVFDKKDVTLKIDIHEVDMKMPEQEFYSKVDAKIKGKINSEDIICKLKQIPNQLELRLEADYLEKILRLMRSKTLIEKLKEQGIKFLYNSIEIEPRVIESRMDEKDLRNEVKEIEAQRIILNMDCDK